MNRRRLRAFPFVVAMLFVVFAFSRPQGRTTWLVLAGACVVVGIGGWRRGSVPPAGGPDA